ncbi:hypothetical protein L916_03658 [Phytophthora nicotianae]|uniref:Uncharacterized protein n=1 Tax=Phytophthora nicotianae TaxID=4792 RepID=W2JL28_PHYNI|nr:hypothetical protein L916_03658 [Phytophthora nicotianae]
MLNPAIDASVKTHRSASSVRNATKRMNAMPAANAIWSCRTSI